MKNPALKVLITAAVLTPVTVYAQPRPGNPTTATVITKAEIDKISATEQSQRVRDENAKVVDIGDGWSMELGIIHRASTRNPPPAPAAGAGKAAAQTVPCGEPYRRRKCGCRVTFMPVSGLSISSRALQAGRLGRGAVWVAEWRASLALSWTGQCA